MATASPFLPFLPLPLPLPLPLLHLLPVAVRPYVTVLAQAACLASTGLAAHSEPYVHFSRHSAVSIT